MPPGDQLTIDVWNAFADGDKQAYATMFRHYHPRLYNYGVKLCASAALTDDCIQDLFVRLWTGRTGLRAVQSPDSYVFVSFRRLVVRAMEQQRQSATRLEDDWLSFSMTVSIDQVIIERERLCEQHINLQSALDKLTGRQKEAIFFMYYEQMSYEEIAAILQISKKAAYKLMARAIAELRTAYKASTHVSYLALLWLAAQPLLAAV